MLESSVFIVHILYFIIQIIATIKVDGASRGHCVETFSTDFIGYCKYSMPAMVFVTGCTTFTNRTFKMTENNIRTTCAF